MSSARLVLLALSLAIGCGPAAPPTQPPPRATLEPSAVLLRLGRMSRMRELLRPAGEPIDALERRLAETPGEGRPELLQRLARAHLHAFEEAYARRARIARRAAAARPAQDERPGARAGDADRDRAAREESWDGGEDGRDDDWDEAEDDDWEADDDWDGEANDDEWEDETDGDDWDDETDDGSWDDDDWDEDWDRAKAKDGGARQDRARARDLARQRRRAVRARRLRNRHAARGGRRRARTAPRTPRAPAVDTPPRDTPPQDARWQDAPPRDGEPPSPGPGSEVASVDAALAAHHEALRRLSRDPAAQASEALQAELDLAVLWTAWRAGSSDAAALGERFTATHVRAGDLLAIAWMVRAEIADAAQLPDEALAAFRFGMNRIGEPIYAYALWRAADVQRARGDEVAARESWLAVERASCPAGAPEIVRVLGYQAVAALGHEVREGPDGILRPETCPLREADAGWRPPE